MSFALTTDAIRRQDKTVTRRLGWKFLRSGDLLQPVKKCQGLKPGESIEKIGGPVRVVSVRREILSSLSNDSANGYVEVQREGFHGMTPLQFVEMFCLHMRPCQPNWEITRIEFEYVESPPSAQADEATTSHKRGTAIDAEMPIVPLRV